jgi:hypothetical protein
VSSKNDVGLNEVLAAMVKMVLKSKYDEDFKERMRELVKNTDFQETLRQAIEEMRQ